ncbi:MAG: biotin--[acetyl-CoA-carboxylase] ligase [Erythrobacter sp.]|nr:biotin--[acetyl-CoA-carboxylase] ligase [Erythrobacter sp.]
MEFVPETGSTNADLLARLRAGEALADGHWLIADRQTSGRGRQGRTWLDAPGNFMGSTVVRLHPHEPSPATLSFVAALAVYEAVLPLLADPATLLLKWPNDVLLGRAKFCGLLLEREGDAVVIGIGVNLVAAPEVEGRLVTALATANSVPPRDLFSRTLAEHLAVELRRWRETGAEPIMRRWQAAAHKPGTPLRVHGGKGEEIAGTYDGLDATGALRLRQPDGTTTVIHAGDVMLED